MFWKQQTNAKDSVDYSKIILDMGKLVSYHSELSEESLISGLVGLGHREKDAYRCYIFTCISFGNNVLKRLEVNFFADEYQVLPKKGIAVDKRSLQSEASFVAAESAQTQFKEVFGTDAFLRLASMSAGLATVNKALKEGCTLEDIKGATVSPPIISGIE